MPEITRLAVADLILSIEGWPNTKEHQIFWLARMAGEWSTEAPKTENDPIDLTEKEPGATAFNSFGPLGSLHVWNYPSLVVFGQAVHDILAAPEYTELGILGRSENTTADELCAASNKTHWGELNPELIGEVRDHFDEYANLELAVTGPEPQDQDPPANPVAPLVDETNKDEGALEHNVTQGEADAEAGKAQATVGDIQNARTHLAEIAHLLDTIEARHKTA